MVGLVDVFKCEKVGDGDDIDGFNLVLGSNVRREGVCGFEAVEEVFTGMDDDEFFHVVKKRNVATVLDFGGNVEAFGGGR